MTVVKEKEIGLVDYDPKKDQIIDVWFQDAIEFGHGISLRIKIKNVLFNARSQYQEISILETEKLGRMLVIDGITMLTEWDEYAYHEMISHVPLLVHPNPSSVLIIGGGDGGTVREVIKHPTVEMVHVCE
jgi:spermidine synthase